MSGDGTIYEASAHALASLPADQPRELTLVAVAIACIAGAASRPDAAREFHAGAWGKGVAELTKLALKLSRDRIETCRRRDPGIDGLFALVLEVGDKQARDPKLATSIELELDRLGAKAPLGAQRGTLH